MSFLSQLWDYLLESNRVLPEYEQVNAAGARLSTEEVKLIALQIKQEEQWTLLEPRIINLYKKTETGTLVWFVDFLLEDMETPYTGYSAAVQIDDETGKIVGKSFVLR